METELLKVALNVLGAGAVAWFTVRLALRRYKSEKIWERRLLAMADVIAALEEMRKIGQVWMDEDRDDPYSPTGLSTDQKVDLNERYRTARRRLDEVASVARLLWSAGPTDVIKEILDQLGSLDAEVEYGVADVEEALEKELAALNEAIEKLIAHWRRDTR